MTRTYPFLLGPDHPGLRGRTGRGVTVAVVDSGVHADHPHVGGVVGGAAFPRDGSERDYLDRLGHGTAVAAAIREKAPDAELYALKVFDSELSTSRSLLIEAIDWASERGIRLINLSLGTPRSGPELPLWACVNRALERGSIVVSPASHGAYEWLPGCLEPALGVELDWTCSRHELRVDLTSEERVRFAASGFPRPIPGVDPERNIKGVSFAAANVTGLLARLLEGRPDLRTIDDVVSYGRTAVPDAPDPTR